MNNQIIHLVHQFKQIDQGGSFVGSSFDYLLKTIDSANVFLSPQPGMKSIAEHISHITFWRNRVIYRIENGKTDGMGDDHPDNWMKVEPLKAIGWPALLKEFNTAKEKLTEVLSKHSDDLLSQSYVDPDTDQSFGYRWLIDGIIQHDVYHLGQIGVIVNYLKNKNE